MHAENGNNKVRVTPLGGVDGVGNASFATECGNIVIGKDFGGDPDAFHQSMKVDPNSPLIIPPPGIGILDEMIRAGKDIYWLITHAHYDHVGAIIEPIKRGIKEERLIMSSWTSRILLKRQKKNLGLRLENDATPPWKKIRERDLSLGNRLVFSANGVECYIFPVNHSIYGSFGILICAFGKKIVYLSDWKFYGYMRNIPDKQNLGKLRDGKGWFDDILRQVWEQSPTGVDCLLLDVMNSDLEGFTPPEEEVVQNLEQIVGEAPNRLFISVISSNLQRIEEIIKMLYRRGKKIGLLGSMRGGYGMLQDRLLLFALNNMTDANDFPLLAEIQTIKRANEKSFRPSVIYDKDEKGENLREELRAFLGVSHANESEVILISGTQGEENSAFTHWAEGDLKVDDKPVRVRKSDWAVISGRVIPSNEDYLRRPIIKLAERCGKVIVHDGDIAKMDLPLGFVEAKILREERSHVSGHESLEGMARALGILRPRIVVPIHAPEDRVAKFEKRFGSEYNIRRLQVGETLEI